MKDYFAYLPENPAGSPGDCTAISVGHVRVAPGSSYPPYRHPVDHHFTWSDGRILHSYTFVFVTEGSGVFESAASPHKTRLEAGTVFIVFPDIWHRYAPDPKTGWVEHWIECRGPAFDRAVKAGMIRPDKPVLPTGLDPDLLLCFERCHALAQQSAPSSQSLLSSLALHLLAVLDNTVRTGKSVQPRINEVIQRAQVLISEKYDQPLNMEGVARELHVGYSYFRQAFRERTGLSPKQYHLQLRLQKAQDFLANTPKSVKEIAEILGFDSAYHLSSQFKSRTGLAPQPWRLRLSRRARR